MSYRDELIRRLEAQGAWGLMTAQIQGRFRELSEDQARQIMVLEDQWTFGEPDTVHLIGLISLVRMIQSFRGALVELQGDHGGRLTRAGRLLAEFLRELSDRGLTSDEVDEGLTQLGPFVIAALLSSYELTS
jgi:hypothetical protein